MQFDMEPPPVDDEEDAERWTSFHEGNNTMKKGRSLPSASHGVYGENDIKSSI